jgi:hypothetical protein
MGARVRFKAIALAGCALLLTATAAFCLDFDSPYAKRGPSPPAPPSDPCKSLAPPRERCPKEYETMVQGREALGQYLLRKQNQNRRIDELEDRVRDLEDVIQNQRPRR